MKFTVLGCYSPYPRPGGATPGYLLRSQGKSFLLDCGSGVLSQLAFYMPVYELDGVFLSHLHHDHISDFFVLQYAILIARKLGKRSSPLSVWAPSEPSSWFSKLAYETHINLNEINGHSLVEFENLSFRFHATQHGDHCYAMEITEDRKKKILYGADSGPNTNWAGMCTSPDLFVCEATYLHKDIPKQSDRHLSAQQAACAASSIRAKHLLLTHLYPEYDLKAIECEARANFKEVSLARPGFSWEI